MAQPCSCMLLREALPRHNLKHLDMLDSSNTNLWNGVKADGWPALLQHRRHVSPGWCGTAAVVLHGGLGLRLRGRLRFRLWLTGMLPSGFFLRETCHIVTASAYDTCRTFNFPIVGSA